MSDYPSKPFSSGTEYEIFKNNYCEICRHHKIREDGFPALVEDGGCPIEDAMEYARFDISMYPNKMIREIRNNDKVEKYHHCLKFEPNKQLKEQKNNDN